MVFNEDRKALIDFLTEARETIERALGMEELDEYRGTFAKGLRLQEMLWNLLVLQPEYSVALEDPNDFPGDAQGDWVVRVSVDIPDESNPVHRFWHGFACTVQQWDEMMASDIGSDYIVLMGATLAEDPYFAVIRDRVEALLFEEFGARQSNGERAKELAG